MISLSSRYGTEKPNNNPAPNAYNKEKYVSTGPMISLASRHKLNEEHISPGPAYYVPNYKST